MAETIFAINLLGLGCGSVLIIAKLIQYKKNVIKMWRFWILVLMVIITLMFSFYLQPQIAELKQLDWQENQQLIEQFSLLHVISKNLFLILSLLGLTLVLSTDKQISFDKAAA